MGKFKGRNADADLESVLLLFDEEQPCWTPEMAELGGWETDALPALLSEGLLSEEEGVFSLTPEGARRFREAAAESFLPLRAGIPAPPPADRKRDADRGLLRLLLDTRHTQRWGIKEYLQPFRFEIPDLTEGEIFSIDHNGERKPTWLYPGHPVFVNMLRDFSAFGLAARAAPPPEPGNIRVWLDVNAPRRRTAEFDLLYKSRYDYRAYAHFPKLPADPCGLLNADRFFFVFGPPPGGGDALSGNALSAALAKLGEFHILLTMLRRMFLPGYVDLDSLDQDGVNWLLYVYEREEDARGLAARLAPLKENLAGPAAPLDIWSLSLDALRALTGTAESIHDVLPRAAHPISRR
jgi:hypothetical protein